MRKLFDQDTPFWRMMERVFDAFELTILWILFCVPIITIGPSTAAFYYSMLGTLRKDGGYVSHDFLKSFRQNLKQGIQLGLLITLTGAFLAFDMYLAYHAGRGIYTFFLFFFLIIFIVWMAVSLYVFMILAKFERTNTETLIWAFTFSLKNLPKTLYLIFLIIFGAWVVHLFPGLILVVPGIVVEHQCVVFMNIFKDYLPAPIASDTLSELPEKDNEAASNEQ